eukprot:2650692-Rhodomonas_salina.1
MAEALDARGVEGKQQVALSAAAPSHGVGRFPSNITTNRRLMPPKYGWVPQILGEVPHQCHASCIPGNTCTVRQYSPSESHSKCVRR